MAYVHKFGIIDDIDEYSEEEFEPERYNYIYIDGDFIDYIYHKGFGDKMRNLKTYAHNINRPYKDLAYYGITLIPPSSLTQFLEIVNEENIKYQSNELVKLITKISEAIENNKWMVHYGI